MLDEVLHCCRVALNQGPVGALPRIGHHSLPGAVERWLKIKTRAGIRAGARQARASAKLADQIRLAPAAALVVAAAPRRGGQLSERADRQSGEPYYPMLSTSTKAVLCRVANGFLDA